MSEIPEFKWLRKVVQLAEDELGEAGGFPPVVEKSPEAEGSPVTGSRNERAAMAAGIERMWPLYDETQDQLRQLQRDMEAYRFAYNYVLAVMERYTKWGKPVNASWVLTQMQKAFNEVREHGVPLNPQESSPPTE